MRSPAAASRKAAVATIQRRRSRWLVNPAPAACPLARLASARSIASARGGPRWRACYHPRSMSARRALLASPLLLLAACGGGRSPTGPGPSPSTGGSESVSVVVFYDESDNGVLDAAEAVRIPDVEVTIGGHTARSAAGTGRAVIAGVSSGSFTPAVTVSTLP